MMSNSWVLHSLKECSDLIGDGLHGTPNYDESGKYYFINGNNLRDNNIIFDNKTRKINHEEFLKYKKPLNDRTILISINGTIGNFARYNEEKIVLGKSACYLNIKDSINKDFVGFVLKNKDFQDYINRFATGSTIKNVSLKTVREYKFNLPEKKEQDLIATFLRSFEDKIELNQKMNQTLEEIAKAIFKSWFEDFDPVRAKAEGKPTGLSDEISNLFPNEFVESKMGNIPKGWFLKPLDEIGSFRNGLALQKFPAQENANNLPVVKIAQLRKGNTISDELFASGIPEDYVIDDGDFIFSWSGSLLAKYWVGGKGALNQHLFKVEGRTMPLWFVAKWVEHYLPKFQEIAEDKATTMGHIKREHLSESLCVIPPKPILDIAEKTISPLIEKTIVLQTQSKLLVQLREILLPKLISGELCIPDTEKFLEEAGI